jgi:peptidoglycan/LPS O-acetylase OafA/YrhL
MRRFRNLGVIPSSGRRLPGIEGLRALAAVSILVVHTWAFAGPGGQPSLGPLRNHLADLAYGVTLFFTLSGFLLYRPFVGALLGARPNFGRYLRNRALRILPAYWAILLLCALVLRSAHVRGPGGELDNGALTDPGLLLRAGLFVQEYTPSTLQIGIGPAWSLAVEVVFYVTLPLLVLVAWTLTRRAGTQTGRIGAALTPAALLLIVGLAGRWTTGHVFPARVSDGWSTNWHSAFERSFFCQADLFAFGMALAVVHTLWAQGKFRLPRHWRPAVGLIALALYLPVAHVSWTGGQLSYSYYNTLVAFTCSLLLALVVLRAEGERSSLVALLEKPPFVAVGLVSYSVFLWHEPLIFWLRAHGLTLDGVGGFAVNLLVVALVTLALSLLTYRLVELPALRKKRPAGEPPRDTAKLEPVAAGVVTASVVQQGTVAG